MPSQVVDISRDITVQVFAVQSDAPRHLSRLSQKEKLKPWGPYDYVYDPSGGDGVDVYVFDTGIEKEHPQFEGRVVQGPDLTGEGAGDQNGHGTCVAGVIGSQSFGVAKRTNLIDVKVLNHQGRGRLSWVLSAMEYVLTTKEQRKKPAVINMSLGAPKNNMLNKVVGQVVAQGVPVVVAAGNSDSSACRVSPASAEGALVIGAFDDRSDSIASFSNWGQCVDAYAPGVNIQSVGRLSSTIDDRSNIEQANRRTVSSGGSTIGKLRSSSHGRSDVKVALNEQNINSQHHYEAADEVTYSGTSVAAPIGAGLIAYFMGMGDSGSSAIQRVKDLSVKNVLSKSTLIFKPWTDNSILYNDGGEPLW